MLNIVNLGSDTSQYDISELYDTDIGGVYRLN